ncbi:MAG TPA: right-handed parallel beta-helix repeat-containing protein [Saprospiraceae bacterium]|nr:right-handed parallel beta-helix repeat-containing protein [Saprospiraceae bacterium]
MQKLLALFILLIMWMSCTKEDFTTDPGDRLSFSADTISFDTVFTTLGSATHLIKIYNTHSKSIEISSIQIKSGVNSKFRINVDGLAGEKFEHVQIRAKDSIYLFCEVTVDPDQNVSESPFVITDEIVFITNNNSQSVVLEAWGQNANYFPAKSNKGMVYELDLQGKELIWNDPKPYILYGIVLVKNGTLRIGAGSKIHVYGGITKYQDSLGKAFYYNDGRLIIGSDARILAEGTFDRPIVFQGVRLEEEYRTVSGQWSTISIAGESAGNLFRNVKILNNQIGLTIDSLASCDLINCTIANNSSYGLYCNAGVVYGENCLFHSQGQNSLVVETGGSVSFQYSTFANFGNTESALFLSNFRCQDPTDCKFPIIGELNAEFNNCIFSGGDRDEFIFKKNESVGYFIHFRNCFMKLNDPVIAKLDEFKASYTQDCIFSSQLDHLFKDISKADFHLDTLSQVEGKAVPISGIDKDLDNQLRDSDKPDIGCFEYID